MNAMTTNTIPIILSMFLDNVLDLDNILLLNRIQGRKTVIFTIHIPGTKTNIVAKLKVRRCHWKGTASYYEVIVENEINKDAAWYYPDPSGLAKGIKDHVAFWKGVRVSK